MIQMSWRGKSIEINKDFSCNCYDQDQRADASIYGSLRINDFELKAR